MTKFHSDDYIRFLRSIRPDNMSEYNKQMQRCKYSSLHTGSDFVKGSDLEFKLTGSELSLEQQTLKYPMVPMGFMENRNPCRHWLVGLVG